MQTRLQFHAIQKQAEWVSQGGGVGYASIVQLLIFACVPRRDFICRLGCGRLVAGRDPFPFPP